MFKYISHGHCYLWNPSLVSLHLVSDFLIAIAYFSIPLMLVYFIQQRQDLPFPYIFWLFSAFIVSCGTTHLMDVWTLWHTTYWFSGTLKVITAIISLFTVFELRIIIPQALALPSPTELEKANQELQKQIVERQRIETQLRESEVKFYAAAEASLDSLFIFNSLRDETGRIVDFIFAELNSRAEQLISMPKSEVLGQRLSELIPINDTGNFLEKYLQVVEMGKVFKEEFSTNIFTSNISWLQQMVVPLADGIAITARDITERKQMENILQEREERFRLAFDRAPIGIALVSTDGSFIRVNYALCAMLGYSELELIQLAFQEITHPEDLATDLIFVQQLLEGKIDFYNIEKRYINQKDNIIWTTLSVSLVKDPLGEPLYFIYQIQNITPRKQNEAEQQRLITQLKISNQELEDFAYVASHDLQEPLRKIQIFGDRLKAKYGKVLDEKGLDYIHRMQSAANRMQTLIRDLLNFSRITTKAQPYVPVTLSQIVAEVIDDLENCIEQTKAQVEVGELPTIQADSIQMRQLFQNLISNALKFHLPENRPIVKVEAILQWETNQVQIMVSDNGIGFEEKYLNRIFTPFQRLHSKQQYQGTGIGLAICRKIVERHNGNITARSIPNQGTTFVITLPMEQSVDKQKEHI
ncbi:MAG: PAS domain S-box protein [Okeania sp. SIO3B5]|uniref:PAS domain S-box protein n=1 Tax=Okeania sp. SIO3B5 TaxID=2607811 RepID=UPI0013FFFD45|nr:PAS domain S-box protein [Okeania sp. SIO3B5]NEO56431.1 PAS domain S-box protein [Okeania sp. SIO3B5]